MLATLALPRRRASLRELLGGLWDRQHGGDQAQGTEVRVRLVGPTAGRACARAAVPDLHMRSCCPPSSPTHAATALGYERQRGPSHAAAARGGARSGCVSGVPGSESREQP